MNDERDELGELVAELLQESREELERTADLCERVSAMGLTISEDSSGQCWTLTDDDGDLVAFVRKTERFGHDLRLMVDRLEMCEALWELGLEVQFTGGGQPGSVINVAAVDTATGDTVYSHNCPRGPDEALKRIMREASGGIDWIGYARQREPVDA